MCGTCVHHTEKNRLASRFSLLYIKVTSKHSINVPKRQSPQLGFTGLSLSLVLGERQLQINRESARHLLICEPTPGLMLPQLVTHFPPPALISESPFIYILFCHVCLCHCICLFPYLCFCMMSIFDFTVLHVALQFHSYDWSQIPEVVIVTSYQQQQHLNVKQPLSASLWYEATCLPLSLLTLSALHFQFITAKQCKEKFKKKSVCAHWRASNEAVCFQCKE